MTDLTIKIQNVRMPKRFKKNNAVKTNIRSKRLIDDIAYKLNEIIKEVNLIL